MNKYWKEQKTIYTIINKETGMFYVCRSGKVGWVSSGAAQNAFKLCTGVSIKDQEDYYVAPFDAEELEREGGEWKRLKGNLGLNTLIYGKLKRLSGRM